MWLKWAFDVPIGIFEWFVLHTNMDNTVEILCKNGPISGKQYTDAYGRRMNGKGGAHHVRQCRRVTYEEWGVELQCYQ